MVMDKSEKSLKFIKNSKKSFLASPLIEGDRVEGDLALGAKNHSPKFHPSFVEAKGLCQDLNKSLFQLEQNMAFFGLAIQEVQDIISTSYSLR